MRKVFDLGKIDFKHKGFKNYQVLVKIELTNDNVFSACGKIKFGKQTIISGQCLDIINEFLSKDKLFSKIYKFWKKYHLNDLHAGTPKQEKALKKVKLIGANYYDEACEYLKSINLYEDNGYKYGSGWLKEEIPTKDLNEIKKLLA